MTTDDREVILIFLCDPNSLAEGAQTRMLRAETFVSSKHKQPNGIDE